MKFEQLHKMIPFAVGGKEKVLSMTPYPNITLSMPGRHAKDTNPIGGDFVVMVTDESVGWENHQFTHSDLFGDLQKKKDQMPKSPSFVMELHAFMGCYLDIIHRDADADMNLNATEYYRDTIHPQTFLHAVQCLAVAEHRRYHQHEAKFGGRYLPFRFSAGIVEGLWTPLEAASKEKYGRPGVEQLERQLGVPSLTKKLMNLDA